jgi:hypothetical protein
MAFVQAKYFGSVVYRLDLQIGGRKLEPSDQIPQGQTVECVQGRRWSRDTQPLTFEFVHGSRTVVDFSLDASFVYMAAFLGRARGVLWDRAFICQQDVPPKVRFVRDIPDVATRVFRIQGPSIDVAWELQSANKRSGKLPEVPNFTPIVDLKHQIAKAAGLSFFLPGPALS